MRSTFVTVISMVLTSSMVVGSQQTSLPAMITTVRTRRHGRVRTDYAIAEDAATETQRLRSAKPRAIGGLVGRRQGVVSGARHRGPMSTTLVDPVRLARRSGVVASAAMTNFAGYVLWCGWLLALAAVLIRLPPRGAGPAAATVSAGSRWPRHSQRPGGAR